MLPRFRLPEWVLVGFFAYIAALIAFFPDRPNLRYQPLVVLAIVTLLFFVLARLEQGRLAVPIRITRDWLPWPLTLVAFREMELFLPQKYNLRYETAWIRWDEIVLREWHLRAAIESLGVLLPSYLEFCYLLVYGIAAYSLGVIVAANLGNTRVGEKAINRFWTVYLTGTLLAYALFPYFPSQPPRYVFPDMEPPTIVTWLRTVNLWLLQGATIHSGVFPSAHVSSAFSAAWGLFLVFPRNRWYGWSMLIYAVSVSIATVYGRYHYLADVVAGIGVSLVAAAVCLLLKTSKSPLAVGDTANSVSRIS